MAAGYPRVGLGWWIRRQRRTWTRALALACLPALTGQAVAGPDPAALWTEAKALEQQGHDAEDPNVAWHRFLEAAATYEVLALAPPGRADACWRSSRMFWLAGETLPPERKVDKIAYFTRSEAMAARGLELDPECAECMLWKFTAMGRLATTRGIWTAMRQVPEMAKLLDRAIELEPSLKILLGVRGDKERALEHSRQALALHPSRLDYQIEVGTQLMCLGSSRRDDVLLAQGDAALERAIRRGAHTQDDEREILAAHIMKEEPGKACGYAGDSWIEIDRDEARQTAVGAAP